MNDTTIARTLAKGKRILDGIDKKIEKKGCHVFRSVVEDLITLCMINNFSMQETLVEVYHLQKDFNLNLSDEELRLLTSLIYRKKQTENQTDEINITQLSSSANITTITDKHGYGSSFLIK